MAHFTILCHSTRRDCMCWAGKQFGIRICGMDTQIAELKWLMGHIYTYSRRNCLCHSSLVDLEPEGCAHTKKYFEKWRALAQREYAQSLSTVMDREMFI